MSSPRPISSHIGSNSGQLARLGRHCRLLKQIDNRLARLLPDDMASHVLVANFRAGSLVLQTDSPAWQTRLRFQVPQLQQQLAEDGLLGDLREIRVTTRPQSTPTDRPQAPDSKPVKRQVSQKTAAVLRSLSQGDHLDPRLSRALEHIAALADDKP